MTDLKFPKEFYENEIKYGFTISEVMKRSWASDIDNLSEILTLCKRHSLKIFACYGTLLGAVREHGFIPWDDDIDMGLVGEDYVRFLDIASKELGNKYRILNPYTREWYTMNFTHITDAAEPNFNRTYLKDKHGCPFGTGPDVYPYYYIPRNPEEEQYILDLLEKIDLVMAMNRQSLASANADGSLKANSSLNAEIATKLVELQYETGYEFTTERPLENQLEILYDQVCRVTEEADADYVCRYDEYTKDRSKKFPKEYFGITIDIPFENITMPVPIGYDAILRARFGGNYIIPKREAAAHGYPYYRKQLSGRDYLKEQLADEKSRISDFGTVVNDNNSNVSNKTKVLYHTNIIDMLIHCDNACENIKKDLDSYTKQDEIEFWWMPGAFPKSDECAWDEVAPDMISEYENMIEEYRRNGGKICSISDNRDKIANYFDEYYGDESIFAEEFRLKGKKVDIKEYS